MPIYNAYSVDFLPCKIKGKHYKITYRTLSRRYHLTENGVEIGRYKHSDLALMGIINRLTGNVGDELPPQYQGLMQRLEKLTGIAYQGLEPNDEPIYNRKDLSRLKQ